MFKITQKIYKKKIAEDAKKYKKYMEILEPNNNELNHLPYDEALKSDNRTYVQYYISLLRVNHLFFFAFFPLKDYNLKIIKIDLFFLNFVLNYSINALFFNDKTMHQIYEDNGNFNFIYHIPQIIYSSLIVVTVFSILKLLALTEKNILDLKGQRKKTYLKEKKDKILKFIKIKILLYTIISIFLTLLFLYYLACFCHVYKNTQIILIKDSLISFALSLFYPFLIYLVPGMFRIPSLKNKKGKRESLYLFSKFLQLL